MRKKIRILLICVIFIILIFQKNIFAKGDFFSDSAKEDKIGDQIVGTVTDGWGYWFGQDDDITMDTDIKLGLSGAESSSNKMISRLLGIIQVIGSIISVVALIIIGFRYMFSSVNEKAELKGILIYYIIGAVLVFATSNLLSIVYKLITGISV